MEQMAAIDEWIASQKPGTAFSAVDLPCELPRGSRDVHLAKLAKAKTIMRVMRGVYCIPSYSKLLGESVPAGVGEIAKAIARKFGWTIMPDDEAAVNGLGLSTQIPARTPIFSRRCAKVLALPPKRYLNWSKSFIVQLVGPRAR